MAPETPIAAVSPSSSVLRFRFPASAEMNRLVSTAKAPEMAKPWPAMALVTCRSLAIDVRMSRYIESQDRQQVTLLPKCLDDFIAEDDTVRIIDAFINELDLAVPEFQGATLQDLLGIEDPVRAANRVACG